jgi:hypothetical protein
MQVAVNAHRDARRFESRHTTPGVSVLIEGWIMPESEDRDVPFLEQGRGNE